MPTASAYSWALAHVWQQRILRAAQRLEANCPGGNGTESLRVNLRQSLERLRKSLDEETLDSEVSGQHSRLAGDKLEYWVAKSPSSLQSKQLALCWICCTRSFRLVEEVCSQARSCVPLPSNSSTDPRLGQHCRDVADLLRVRRDEAQRWAVLRSSFRSDLDSVAIETLERAGKALGGVLPQAVPLNREFHGAIEELGSFLGNVSLVTFFGENIPAEAPVAAWPVPLLERQLRDLDDKQVYIDHKTVPLPRTSADVAALLQLQSAISLQSVRRSPDTELQLVVDLVCRTTLPDNKPLDLLSDLYDDATKWSDPRSRAWFGRFFAVYLKQVEAIPGVGEVIPKIDAVTLQPQLERVQAGQMVLDIRAGNAESERFSSLRFGCNGQPATIQLFVSPNVASIDAQWSQLPEFPGNELVDRLANELIWNSRRVLLNRQTELVDAPSRVRQFLASDQGSQWFDALIRRVQSEQHAEALEWLGWLKSHLKLNVYPPIDQGNRAPRFPASWVPEQFPSSKGVKDRRHPAGRILDVQKYSWKPDDAQFTYVAFPDPRLALLEASIDARALELWPGIASVLTKLDEWLSAHKESGSERAVEILISLANVLVEQDTSNASQQADKILRGIREAVRNLGGGAILLPRLFSFCDLPRYQPCSEISAQFEFNAGKDEHTMSVRRFGFQTMSRLEQADVVVSAGSPPQGYTDVLNDLAQWEPHSRLAKDLALNLRDWPIAVAHRNLSREGLEKCLLATFLLLWPGENNTTSESDLAILERIRTWYAAAIENLGVYQVVQPPIGAAIYFDLWTSDNCEFPNIDSVTQEHKKIGKVIRPLLRFADGSQLRKQKAIVHVKG